MIESNETDARRARLETPVPKSSKARRTPRRFSRSRLSKTGEFFPSSALSVISSSRKDGGRPLSRSARSTSSTIPPFAI